MQSPKIISCLLMGAVGLGSANASDALDLMTQLQWEATAELSIPSATEEWGKPTILGITGSKVGKFDFSKRFQSTGSDDAPQAMTSRPLENDLGLGDLLGGDKTEKIDDLGLGDLMGGDDSEKIDDLGLGDLMGGDDSKATDETLDLGDDSLNSPKMKSANGDSEKPNSSALGMGKSTPEEENHVSQNSAETQGVFHFKLGNVHVMWKQGYAPAEARVTTSGSFTLENFLEAIDQPGLLEVHKNKKVQQHLQDSIQLQFTQARLTDVLNWISDAYQTPYTLKNRSLHL